MFVFGKSRMEDTSKAQLENLKRYVMVSIAAILALLEGFCFFVMKVPLVECVLEWLFGLSVCLVILHVSFEKSIAVNRAMKSPAWKTILTPCWLNNATAFVMAFLLS